MKLIYFLYSENLSQFSYLYNLYLLYPSPIYCPTFDNIKKNTLPKSIYSATIFRNIEDINKYNPDLLLHTGNSAIKGPWKNIFVGHGYSSIFSNECASNIIVWISKYNIRIINNNIYDYIIVPSDLIKDEIYKQAKISNQKIIVSGTVRYENINNRYFINFNRKKIILYAPSWLVNPSVLIMQNYLKELSNHFNIFVLFHSSSINNYDSRIDVINAQKKIVGDKNESLKIIFRDEYSSLFEGFNQKNVIKNTNETLNILQELVLSCEFVLCDVHSSVFWDALYFQKPFLKIDSNTNIEIEDLKNKINTIQPVTEFSYCGKKYTLDDIFGHNNSSSNYIKVLKTLINN